MVCFANLPSKNIEEEAADMPESGSSDQEVTNGKLKRKTEVDGEVSKKRSRKSRGDKSTKVNGSKSLSKRRHSVSKPARDPRDQASLPESPREDDDAAAVRSPSPVIDFDGLSKPSKCSLRRVLCMASDYFTGLGTRERKEESPEQAAARLEKMTGAIRTILECIGEDPNREGLLATPMRYAKAMLDFTKGYQENVKDIVNDAIFHEDHNELVIVKDIEVFSLCEHHMVPFTGKVNLGRFWKTISSLLDLTDAHWIHT